MNTVLENTPIFVKTTGTRNKINTWSYQYNGETITHNVAALNRDELVLQLARTLMPFSLNGTTLLFDSSIKTLGRRHVSRLMFILGCTPADNIFDERFAARIIGQRANFNPNRKPEIVVASDASALDNGTTGASWLDENGQHHTFPVTKYKAENNINICEIEAVLQGLKAHPNHAVIALCDNARAVGVINEVIGGYLDPDYAHLFTNETMERITAGDIKIIWVAKALKDPLQTACDRLCVSYTNGYYTPELAETLAEAAVKKHNKRKYRKIV